MENASEHQAFWDNARSSVGELLAQMRTVLSDSGEVAHQAIEAHAVADEVDRALSSELAHDESRLGALRESYTRMLWMGLRRKAAYLPGC
jgi:hypothetical protein